MSLAGNSYKEGWTDKISGQRHASTPTDDFSHDGYNALLNLENGKHQTAGWSAIQGAVPVDKFEASTHGWSTKSRDISQGFPS